ncbi:hypothetical protein Tco_1452664, partial [Tanacetum coccineum]
AKSESAKEETGSKSPKEEDDDMGLINDKKSDEVDLGLISDIIPTNVELDVWLICDSGFNLAEKEVSKRRCLETMIDQSDFDVEKFRENFEMKIEIRDVAKNQVLDCLTPEILATLASLAKANSNGQQLSGNMAARPPLTSVAADERKFRGLPMQASQPYQLDLHVVSGVMSSSRVRATNVSEPQGVVSHQQNSEFDAEKNERYQSTLKFTASLLLQIQQKQ